MKQENHSKMPIVEKLKIKWKIMKLLIEKSWNKLKNLTSKLKILKSELKNLK